jgi:metallophosphoesterase superfamily enzyme
LKRKEGHNCAIASHEHPSTQRVLGGPVGREVVRVVWLRPRGRSDMGGGMHEATRQPWAGRHFA